MTGLEDEQKKRASRPLLSFAGKPDPEGSREGRGAPVSDPRADIDAERHRLAHAKRMAELERRLQEAEEKDEPTHSPDADRGDAAAEPDQEMRIREEMAAVEADLRARLETGESRLSPPAPAATSQSAGERNTGHHRSESARDDQGASREYQAREYQDREHHDDEWKPLVDPRAVFDALRRSRNLILAMAVLGTLLGVAYALSSPKMYVSSVDLLVDPREIQGVGRDLTPDQLPTDASLAIAESQARIINSSSVLSKVIDRAGLARDPEFNGSLKPSGIAGFVAAIRNMMSGNGAEDATELETRVLNNLYKSLTIVRDPKSFVFSISVKTRNPEKSAYIANTISQVFQEQLGSIQSDAVKRTTESLSGRLADMRSGVEKAESAVEKFRAEHDLVDVQGRLIGDDEITSLNNQLSAARAETIRLNARAQSLRGTTADSLFTSGLPEGLNSGAITALRSQYAAARQQADGLATKLGPRHPQLIQLQSQAEGLRREVEAELTRIRSSIQVDLRRSVQQEQDLAARMAQLKVRHAGSNEDLVKLRELERNANAQRSVYEAFLLRTRETREQGGLDTAIIRVISEARPALEPAGPSRRNIVLVGLLLGLFAGLGIAVLRGIYASLVGGGSDRPYDRDYQSSDFDPQPPTPTGGGNPPRRQSLPERDPQPAPGESRLAAAMRQAREGRAADETDATLAYDDSSSALSDDLVASNENRLIPFPHLQRAEVDELRDAIADIRIAMARYATQRR
ncbi:chain-length determining protein [Phyllobacterium salinisoli]|uniref:Chain-length determining protein n=1 Tax=Phyllobacterium salinisoli TaxID=1899321 RepID=A0A368K5J7_9HYPH|nr:GumC family protein [Phyllobacterium salinisoli]RCS24657.1 chain-length determining protein [Phyllobacterium salinisoli]